MTAIERIDPWSLPDAPGALRVGGLDPSLASTGIAVTAGPDTVPLLYRVQPGKLRGHERLAWILDMVLGHVAHCDVVAVEGVLSGMPGAEAHLKLAGLHWLIRHRLWEAKIPYAVITPATRAKWLTGNGGAGKDTCLAAAIRRFPRAEIGGNDMADALTVAAMAAAAYGQPLAPMPKDRTELLHAVRTDRNHRGEPVIDWPQLNGRTR